MMKGYDIGIQEKKAKLFNEWERFTSKDRESIESYYHCFLKLMNDLKRNKHFPEKIASNLKFLNNLQPEWSRHVTIVHQTKDLHTAGYTQLYDFLKYNQKKVDDLKAERLAKTQDPLALMATSNNPYTFPVLHQDQPSFNQNYMQQPMLNPEDITDPTTAINMALALMDKAFKLNYSTPSNNNQRISSNPRNRQIAQPGINMGQDRQMQMVGGNGGNQLRQYAGQNVRNLNGYIDVQNVGNQVIHHAVQNIRIQNVGNQNGLIGVPGNANQNPNGNGNLVAARAEVRPRRRDTAYLQTQLLIAQKEETGIQLQAEEFDLMVAATDLDEIEEVNANCILMANLQQASTSDTQTDKAPVYDSNGLAEVHNYENCYDNEIFNMFTQDEQYTELLEPILEPHQVSQNDNIVISEDSCVEQSERTVEQHPINVEETHTLYDSLYNNLAIEVEKVNTVNHKLSETNAELTTELARYKNQEMCFEISQEKYDKLERCYQQSVYQEKCLSKKINALHLSSGKQIMTLNEEISDLNKQLSMKKSTVSSLLEEMKKLKSDFKIREDELLDKKIQLKKRIKELDNSLGNSANTKFAKQSILGKPPKVGETYALSKPVTSNSIPTPPELKVVKNAKRFFGFLFEKMSRDVLTVGSTMRILLLYRGEYSQWVESNKTAKDLRDALAKHMLGSEYGEQDRKATVLYEYETFKAIEGELFLDTYIQYLQVTNDLKKCGYSKDNYVNDAIGLKKKTILITSDPLALIADKTNVSKSKEKVVVSLDSEGSEADDFSELKKITALLAKAFNRRNDSNQEINANMVFMAQIEKVLSDSEASSSSADDKISEASYYLSESESEYEYETSEYYDNTTTYGLFVNDNDDQEFFHECENFLENLIESQIDHNESVVDHNDFEGIDKLIKKFNKKIVRCQKRIEKADQQSKDFKNQNKDLQDKYNVLKNQATTFKMNNKELNE
nr:hypothetical protein [Tanacetum cinerariifolium]